MRTTSLLGAAAFLVASALVPSAHAQQPQGDPGYTGPPPGYTGPPPGYGAPQPGYAPQPAYGAPQQAYGAPPPAYPSYSPSSGRRKSTALEIGYLYGAAGAWGLGVGMWIDAEAHLGFDNAGVAFIPPAVFGVAGPVGVFFLDRPAMPEGLPSAIATGLVLGAAEGISIASYQFVSASYSGITTVGAIPGGPLTLPVSNGWDFRSFMRAEVLGSTIGGLGGAAYGYLTRPTPKKNLLIASGAAWGQLIGIELGGGASGSHLPWSQTNDSVALGGLVGMNVFIAGTAALSTVWSPSWEQLAWMWGGLGVGTAAALPVYAFYATGQHDARRGLIFQGVAGMLGIGAGALIGRPDRPGAIAKEEPAEDPGGRHAVAKILGGGLMPVMGGMGLSLNGEIY